MGLGKGLRFTHRHGSEARIFLLDFAVSAYLKLKIAEVTMRKYYTSFVILFGLSLNISAWETPDPGGYLGSMTYYFGSGRLNTLELRFYDYVGGNNVFNIMLMETASGGTNGITAKFDLNSAKIMFEDAFRRNQKIEKIFNYSGVSGVIGGSGSYSNIYAGHSFSIRLAPW